MRLRLSIPARPSRPSPPHRSRSRRRRRPRCPSAPRSRRPRLRRSASSPAGDVRRPGLRGRVPAVGRSRAVRAGAERRLHHGGRLGSRRRAGRDQRVAEERRPGPVPRRRRRGRLARHVPQPRSIRRSACSPATPARPGSRLQVTVLFGGSERHDNRAARRALQAGASWSPTPIMPVVANLFALLSPGGYAAGLVPLQGRRCAVRPVAARRPVRRSVQGALAARPARRPSSRPSRRPDDRADRAPCSNACWTPVPDDIQEDLVQDRRGRLGQGLTGRERLHGVVVRPRAARVRRRAAAGGGLGAAAVVGHAGRRRARVRRQHRHRVRGRQRIGGAGRARAGAGALPAARARWCR